MLDKSYFEEIKGAVYIPTQAYNAYQMWRDYTSEVTERDLGYAKSININSLRIWMSYEYWLSNKEDFESKLEDFLSIADSKGIRVMPSMFECCGREPNEENILDRDQFTGTAVRSPGTVITEDPSRWNEPFAFIDWFLGKYRNDRRVLATEVTNEPKSDADQIFAIALLKRCKEIGGTVPVTLGGQELADNILYRDYIDVYQTHENIVLSEFALRSHLERMQMLEHIDKKPVWITEWQRMRKSGVGFNSEYVAKEELRPAHVTMAGLYREYGIGNFVWSLMLKPAYLTGQRKVGTFSGIFHEDGSVYSLEDARAVAGDDKLVLPENHTLPKCFDRVAALSE